jgi:hypothetical protein
MIIIGEEEEEEEEEVEEEEEEDIFIVEIEVNKKNIDFYTNDEINGDIYEINLDETVGKKIGVFKNEEPHFY